MVDSECVVYQSSQCRKDFFVSSHIFNNYVGAQHAQLRGQAPYVQVAESDHTLHGKHCLSEMVQINMRGHPP